MISYNNIMMATGLYPKLKFTHLIALRLGFPFVGYFILSVSLFTQSTKTRLIKAPQAFYALLSFAFGAPFTDW